MGVSTASNASPATMAANIKAIETKTGEIAGVGAKFVYSGTEGKNWSGAKGIVYWSGDKLLVSVAGTYSVNGASAKRYAKGATVYSFSTPTWGETNAVIIAVTHA